MSIAYELQQSDDWLKMRSIERTINLFYSRVKRYQKYGSDTTELEKLLDRYETILKGLKK